MVLEWWSPVPKCCIRLSMLLNTECSPDIVEAIIRVCPRASVSDYYGDTYDESTAGNVLEMMRKAGETCMIRQPTACG